MVAIAEVKRHAARIVKQLKAAYPAVHCALEFETPLQLLVATILSAQCTDVRVNLVTPALFQRYPDAQAFAQAKLPELERLIQSTGFFRNKAKNIKACCVELVERYDGEVPKELDHLVRLAGVGRKTANVVLGTAFGIPTGVVVDTHVKRLTHRLGMTRQTDPVKIEQELIQQLPKREWIDFSHRLIAHGRQVCVARGPKCDICPLATLCPRIGVAQRKTKGDTPRSRKPSRAIRS